MSFGASFLMAAQRSARRAVRQTAFGRYERETEWEPDGEASEFADLVGAEIHLAQNESPLRTRRSYRVLELLLGTVLEGDPKLLDIGEIGRVRPLGRTVMPFCFRKASSSACFDARPSSAMRCSPAPIFFCQDRPPQGFKASSLTV